MTWRELKRLIESIPKDLLGNDVRAYAEGCSEIYEPVYFHFDSRMFPTRRGIHRYKREPKIMVRKVKQQ